MSLHASLAGWRKKLNEHVEISKVKIVVCANKIDLLNNDQYDMSETEAYVATHGMVGAYATSAKTNHNIEKVFQCLINAIASTDGEGTEFKGERERAIERKSNPGNSISNSNSNRSIILVNSTAGQKQKRKKRFGFC